MTLIKGATHILDISCAAVNSAIMTHGLKLSTLSFHAPGHGLPATRYLYTHGTSMHMQGCCKPANSDSLHVHMLKTCKPACKCPACKCPTNLQVSLYSLLEGGLSSSSSLCRTAWRQVMRGAMGPFRIGVPGMSRPDGNHVA